MNHEEIQTYINNEIPLVKKAGLIISEISRKKVIVSGELHKNRNHHETVFGGSISVTLTLASYLLVREIMEKEAPGSSIVICSQNVEYLKPVKGDFQGEVLAPDSQTIKNYLDIFRKRGTGKLEVEAALYEIGNRTACALFKGVFFIRKG